MSMLENATQARTTCPGARMNYTMHIETSKRSGSAQESTQSMTAAQQKELCSQWEQAEPFPIPPHWGDPTNYEWKPLAGKYWCTLCWKYAEDKHINSDRHAWNASYRDCYARYLANQRVPPYEGAQQQPLYSEQPPPPPGPPPGYISSDYIFCKSASKSQSAHPPRGYTLPPPAPAGPDQTSASLPPYSDASCTSQTPSGDIKSKRWHRYAVDHSHTEYWWCSPWSETDQDISFREDAPGEWCRYKDPSTGENYRWFSDEYWFWEKSGTTILTRFCKEELNDTLFR